MVRIGLDRLRIIYTTQLALAYLRVIIVQEPNIGTVQSTCGLDRTSFRFEYHSHCKCTRPECFRKFQKIPFCPTISREKEI